MRKIVMIILMSNFYLNCLGQGQTTFINDKGGRFHKDFQIKFFLKDSLISIQLFHDDSTSVLKQYGWPPPTPGRRSAPWDISRKLGQNMLKILQFRRFSHYLYNIWRYSFCSWS